MSENSFIHTISVNLDMKKPKNLGSNVINIKYLKKHQTIDSDNSLNENEMKDCLKLNNNDNFIINNVPATKNIHKDNNCDKKLSIVDEILADFSEWDIEYSYHQRSAGPSSVSSQTPKHVYFQPDSNSGFSSENENIEELIITCNTGELSKIPTDPRIQKPSGKITKVELNSSPAKRFIKSSQEKSPENCNLTEVAAKTYEFSEDNEKCEKISIFRKRRLADKKYEFSEDNSENIIPFNRTRMRLRNEWPIYKCTPLSPAVTSSHYNYNMYEPHSHRASPNHGFRSPCGSPVSNRFLKSPPGFRSPSYRSPSRLNHLLLSPPKNIIRYGTPGSSQSFDEGHKYFSDIINRIREIRSNPGFITEHQHHHDSDVQDLKAPETSNGKTDKPLCSKKIIKHYVEEDDATSVVTNEEDDCISPG
jgi:DDB1- and CUL4-associated factor 15